jgi:hypothetical protein
MEAVSALFLIFLLSQNLQGNLALGVATFDKFRVKSAGTASSGRQWLPGCAFSIDDILLYITLL